MEKLKTNVSTLQSGHFCLVALRCIGEVEKDVIIFGQKALTIDNIIIQSLFVSIVQML